MSDKTGRINEPYRKGQHIFYKGENAQVLEVKPVFTIKIEGRCHVVCGNILDDVRPAFDRNLLIRALYGNV